MRRSKGAALQRNSTCRHPEKTGRDSEHGVNFPEGCGNLHTCAHAPASSSRVEIFVLNKSSWSSSLRHSTRLDVDICGAVYISWKHKSVRDHCMKVAASHEFYTIVILIFALLTMAHPSLRSHHLSFHSQFISTVLIISQTTPNHGQEQRSQLKGAIARPCDHFPVMAIKVGSVGRLGSGLGECG